MQSATAQIGDTEIVQFRTAQMPSFLNMKSFTNHIEIINRCKTIEERVFYVLYAYRERLTIKELQRCMKTDVFTALSLSKGLMEANLTNRLALVRLSRLYEVVFE